MRALMIIAATLAIAAVVIAGGCGKSEPTWSDLEREAKAARIETTVEPVDVALTVFWRAAPAVVVVIIVVVATRAAWLAVERRHRERWPRIGDGALPVRADDLPTLAPAALEAYHVTQLAEAVHRPPHTLHYAPRYAAAPVTAAPVTAAQSADDDAIPAAPSLRDLVTRGWWPTPDAVILGYGSSGPVAAPITGLLSTAVAGRPGTGKSALLRLVAWQTLAIGGQVYLFDPHGSVTDDLAAWPLTAAAATSAEMTTLARALTRLLERRIAAYRAGERAVTPIVTLIDELPAIVATTSNVVSAISRIVLEGRKVGMYAYLAGQGLPAGMTGGRLVRDALASRYVFRTTPDEARRVGLGGDAARAVERLRPGVAVVDAGILDRPTPLAIPWCAPEDGALLARAREGVPVGRQAENDGSRSGSRSSRDEARRTGRPAGEEPRGSRSESRSSRDEARDEAQSDGEREDREEPRGSRSESRSSRDEAREAAERFLAGESPAEIVRAMRGIASNAGSVYQRALAEILDLIREGIRHREQLHR